MLCDTGDVTSVRQRVCYSSSNCVDMAGTGHDKQQSFNNMTVEGVGILLLTAFKEQKESHLMLTVVMSESALLKAVEA